MVKRKMISLYSLCTKKQEFLNSETFINVALKFILRLIKKTLVYLTLSIVYFECFFGKKVIFEGKTKVIVSLTTFPARIDSVWLTLFSMTEQSVKPERIILYLSKLEFPDKDKDLPKKLIWFKKKGLEICYVEDNLKPHKKYYYAFEAYRNRSIITIDDDLYYPSDTIERLLRISNVFPNCVCANRASKIAFNSLGVVPYKEWKPVRTTWQENGQFIAIGCGGVLYPASFRPPKLFEKETLNKTAPDADDLWLKAHQVLNNINVAVGDYFPHPMVIPKSQKVSLMRTNAGGVGKNDIQWAKLDEEFNVNRIMALSDV